MKSKFKHGVFYPLHKEKFIGDKLPEYRSGWELKFFRWADNNVNILAWGSENIVIPYINPLDNRVHRYFVDNFIVFRDKNGNKKKFLIEIKPSQQVAKPVDSKGKHKKTKLYEQCMWIKNQSKWEAAKKWADKNNTTFMILTEKELGIG